MTTNNSEMTYAGYAKSAALEFATRAKALGFTVYMSKTGSYGVLTDETESRVLSFSGDIHGGCSGNYYPPSRESGTGWRMDCILGDLQTADDIRKALYSSAPRYCGKGFSRYATLADYLRLYGQSSGFTPY